MSSSETSLEPLFIKVEAFEISVVRERLRLTLSLRERWECDGWTLALDEGTRPPARHHVMALSCGRYFEFDLATLLIRVPEIRPLNRFSKAAYPWGTQRKLPAHEAMKRKGVLR